MTWLPICDQWVPDSDPECGTCSHRRSAHRSSVAAYCEPGTAERDAREALTRLAAVERHIEAQSSTIAGLTAQLAEINKAWLDGRARPIGHTSLGSVLLSTDAEEAILRTTHDGSIAVQAEHLRSMVRELRRLRGRENSEPVSSER